MLPYLPSKTFIPLVRGGFVRSRLLDALDEGLPRKLTLIAAPAGYGKSTLASMWLHGLQGRTGTDGRPGYHCAWFSVEESESQFELFFGYLIQAIRATLPGALPRSHAYLAQPAPVAPALFATVLTSECAELPATVLVLDDLHTVRTEAVYQVLNAVVRHAPNLHLVVLARRDPPLEIARLRGRSQLSEIRLADLQFTRAEAEALLTSRLGRLDAAIVDVLHSRTEGWVTGLQLAALRLRGQAEPTEFIRTLNSFGDRYVADYLFAEVLQTLPAEVQSFLMGTATLMQLSAPLCAAVLGQSLQEAREHLSFLDCNNLFLIALDEDGQWYRYHHQFRQSLLAHGRHVASDVAVLHSRAGGWYAAQRMIDEALHHLVLAGEGEAGARLVEENLAEIFNAERHHDLNRWLEHLPAAIVNRRPLLLGAKALYLGAIGALESVPELVRSAEELIARGVGIDSPAARDEALGICAASVPGLAPLQLSFEDRIIAGQRALDLLPPRHQMLRGVVYYDIANRLRNLGQFDVANDLLTRALEASSPAEVALRFRIRISLATGHYLGGSLAEAERHLIRALEDVHAVNAAYTLCLAHYGMGVILLQRFEFEQARGSLALACDPDRPGMLNIKIMAAYALLRLLAEQGEQFDTDEIDRMIAQTAKADGGKGFELQFAALSAYSRWASGDKGRAYQWAFQAPLPLINPEYEIATLVRARILLDEGSAVGLAHAEERLRAHLASAFRGQPGFIILEVRLLLAQVRWQRGDEAEALDMMEALVNDAYPRCFRRLFLDPAIDGRAMLRALAAQGRCVAEAEALLHLATVHQPETLARSGVDRPSRTVDSSRLVEPLTTRELEVLILLSQGFDYKGIAERMVVSPHTVRNHLRNVYGKLNVHSRNEAMHSARSLGLLPPT